MAFPEGVGIMANIEVTAAVHATVSDINELVVEFQKQIDEGAETFIISKENIQSMMSLMKMSATLTSLLFEGHQKFTDAVEEVKKKHDLP